MRTCRSRGFAAVELAAAVLAVGVLFVVLLFMSSASRAHAWQGETLANLKQFASGTGSFAADNQDRFWTFSWQPNVLTPSTYPDLRGPFADGMQSGAAQAVDILRRRAGRTDIGMITGWIPHIFYSHLPLADYLGTELPLRFAVSPGDRHRLLWSGDPQGYDQGRYQPSPGFGDNGNKRWPYGSSFKLPCAFFSPDFTNGAAGTVSQSSQHNTFFTAGNTVFGTRRVTEVVYPAQKVHLFDEAARRPTDYDVYYLYPHARIPMLMVDGSARVRPTMQANRGFNPRNPTAAFPTTISYVPAPWESPVITANGPVYGPSFNSPGVYFWTRMGITGRDFDGQEVPAP